VDHWEGRRRYRPAIEGTQRLLQEDPLEEDDWERLMRLHMLEGNRPRALQAYHECRSTLQRELGVEPRPSIREAYLRLTRAHDLPGGAAAGAPRTAVKFVSRSAEWQRAQDVCRRALQASHCHLVLVRGEIGIGKTRFLEEILHWAARQGVTTIDTAAYPGETGLPHAVAGSLLRSAPVVRAVQSLDPVWQAEVARLTPELLGEPEGPGRPEPLVEDWQRRRFVEGLAQAVLATPEPRVLAVDDVQWCDRESAQWLDYLLHHEEAAGLLVCATIRAGVDVPDTLDALFTALQRKDQLTAFNLEPLSEVSTLTLATEVARRELPAGTAEWIYRESEGNPLFVVEMVRAWTASVRERDRASEAPGPETSTRRELPDKVLAVILSRLKELPPESRALLEVAAVVGRRFSVEVLAATGEFDEQTLVRCLDELWDRRLILDREPGHYDFAHGLFRKVVYDTIGPARRRLLHHRVADGLACLHRSEPGPVAARLAYHYEQAGVMAQAVEFYRQAARFARGMLLKEETLRYLDRALGLLDERAGMPAAEIWEERGDALHALGDSSEAEAAYRRSAALAPGDDGLRAARLHRKRGDALKKLCRYDEAGEAYAVARARLPVAGTSPGPGTAPEVIDEWLSLALNHMDYYYQIDDLHTMEQLARVVEPVVKKHGSPVARGLFSVSLAEAGVLRDRFVSSDETIAHAEDYVATAEGLDDRAVLGHARFCLGFCHFCRRDLEKAEELLQFVLSTGREARNPSLQTLALAYLTFVFRLGRQTGEVRRYAELALSMAEANDYPNYVASSRAHLGWLAWREGDPATTRELGELAVAFWDRQQPTYPFQWAALWPLMAVALDEGRPEQAVDCARRLLESHQQDLPRPLKGIVQEASSGGPGAAAALREAVEMARDFGYL